MHLSSCKFERDPVSTIAGHYLRGCGQTWATRQLLWGGSAQHSTSLHLASLLLPVHACIAG